MDHPDLEGFSLSRVLGRLGGAVDRYGPSVASAIGTVERGGGSFSSIAEGVLQILGRSGSTPIVPTGTTTTPQVQTAAATRGGGMPGWFWPALVGGGVLLFAMRRR